MKFETETEPLPASRPFNWRKLIIIIACTAIICGLLIIVYVGLESVNREKIMGCTPELGGMDGHTGQGGAHGAESHQGQPELQENIGLKEKSGPPGPTGPQIEMETVNEGMENFTASKGTVEGIIAGTSTGVVIIPLDSLEQRTISSKFTEGVAFNWRSRKVYWIESSVGIKIADLDGSSAELLISANTSALFGLAVDQITGNVYYGVTGSQPQIRVCDSTGKKCETVASGVNNVGYNTWDIALFPSQGLMFWSSPFDKSSVTRANMDGSNATVIILGNIGGIYLDEFAERLYWTNYDSKSFGHSDLNGNDRNVLLNTAVYPYDLAVDRDTLYLGNYSPYGVYSVASNGKISSIANTTGDVYHIALYGRNKVSYRRNPCKNSPCANLCVLTRVSYTCL